MQELREELINKLGLQPDHADLVLSRFSEDVVRKALKATVFPSKDLFKMNLSLYSRHPQ